MNQRFPVRAIAGCLALSAFSVAIVSGLSANRSTNAILTDALLFLLLGQIAGYILALVLQAALRERLAQYERANPIPVDASPGGAAPTFDDDSPSAMEVE